MPRQKDLKRLVRARMSRTGEAYTTARAQIARKSESSKTSTRAASAAPTAVTASTRTSKASQDYAAIAGMSDEKVKQKTGCTWERWVHALDRRGAAEMSHGDIATIVTEKYKIDGWWSQMVTVGYERIKGLRARGQRRDGTYEANKTRTFDVPVDELFHVWHDARMRKRWLDEKGVKVRTASASRSMRLGWPDGSIIAVAFMAKGESKSAVSVQHTKLPDATMAERLKKYWAERFDLLRDLFEATSA